MPRAPSHAQGVTSRVVASGTTSTGVTPPSSLLRAHAPVLIPPAAYGRCLGQPVFAGCGQPLLGGGPSRVYLCRSFPACPDPYPGAHRGARARFFLRGVGLLPIRSGLAVHIIPTATSVGGAFRGCSHFVMFRPAGLLATLVAPTLVPTARSSCDLYLHAYHGSLPPRAADMLTVQTEQLTARGLSPLQIDSLLGCSPDPPLSSRESGTSNRLPRVLFAGSTDLLTHATGSSAFPCVPGAGFEPARPKPEDFKSRTRLLHQSAQNYPPLHGTTRSGAYYTSRHYRKLHGFTAQT